MALKDITQNKAYQARNATQTTTPVVQQPQVSTSPIPSPTQTSQPVTQQTTTAPKRPINKVTWQVAGANNPTMQQPQTQQQNVPITQPVQGDYTTTNPNAQWVSQYTFNESAKQLNAQDPNYLNNRDDYIANQIVNQLNSMTKQWQKIDSTVYDWTLNNVIQQFGGNIDYNNPDWLNTINRINSKIQTKTGAKDMNAIYGNMNKTLDKVNQYNTWDGLYQAIANGQVSKDQMDLIRQTKPELYQEYATYQDNQFKLSLVNGTGLSATTLLSDTIDTDGLFAKFGLDKASSNDIDLVQKRMELLANGSVSASQDKYIAQAKEYQKLQDTVMNIEDEVRKQYEGTWVTESYIQAMTAKRTGDLKYKMQELQRGVMIAQEDYNLEVGQLNEMMNTYKEQSTIDLQYEQLNQQKFGIVYETLQAEQKRRDDVKLADIDFMQGIYQMKYSDELQNGNINSSDPYVREKAIDKEVTGIMAQYDWLIMSSKGQLMERVKKDMANGKTYADSISSIMLDIRNKPEYKQFMAMKSWVNTLPQSIWWWLYAVQNSDGTWTTKTEAQLSWQKDPTIRQQINQSMQAEREANGSSQYDNYDFVNQILNWQLKTRDGTVCLPGQEWGQCGAFVNDMIGTPWLFQSDISQKINVTKNPEWYSPWPIVWWAVVIDTGTKYGHVWIVTAVYPDGSYDYVDSNYRWDEKIAVQKNKKPSSKTYFTRAKDRPAPSSWVVSGTTWVTWTTTWYNTDYAGLYRKANEWKLTKEDYAQINGMWISTNAFLAQSQNWKKDQIAKWNTEVMWAIDYLLNNYPWRTSAMLSNTTVWKLSGKLSDFNTNFNLIRSKLTMDALVSIKDQWATFGALSDGERTAIWDSISALSLSNSEAEFKKNLTKAKEILNRASWWSTQSQYTTNQVQTNSLTSAFSSLWWNIVKSTASRLAGLPF